MHQYWNMKRYPFPALSTNQLADMNFSIVNFAKFYGFNLGTSEYILPVWKLSATLTLVTFSSTEVCIAWFCQLKSLIIAIATGIFIILKRIKVQSLNQGKPKFYSMTSLDFNLEKRIFIWGQIVVWISLQSQFFNTLTAYNLVSFNVFKAEFAYFWENIAFEVFPALFSCLLIWAAHFVRPTTGTPQSFGWSKYWQKNFHKKVAQHGTFPFVIVCWAFSPYFW